jgi:hypothetical protein
MGAIIIITKKMLEELFIIPKKNLPNKLYIGY